MIFLGDRFLLSTENGLIKIFDTQTGETLQTLSDHQDRVNQARWSPIGDLIATSSRDGTVIVWQTKTGKALYTIPVDIRLLASWSPSGDRFSPTRIVGGVSVDQVAHWLAALKLSLGWRSQIFGM